MGHQQTTLLWVIAITIAGAITGFLEGSIFQFASTLLFTGVLLGIAEYLVLRHVGINWRWIAVTAIGWILGTFFTIRLPFSSLATWLFESVGLWEVFWLNLLQMPLWVLPMAIVQWWLLRERPNAWWWILITMIAGAAQGAFSSGTAYYANIFTGALQTTLVYGIGWLVFGIITAFGLLILKIED